MATKRSSIDANLYPVVPTPTSTKRTKSSPVAVPVEDHSEASAHSTLICDQNRSRDGDAYAVSASRTGQPSRNEDEEFESPGSPAADDSAQTPSALEPQSEDVTCLPRVGGGSDKPEIDPDVLMAYANELKAKLHTFLPKLRDANSKLNEQGSKLNMERVHESEPHIEMNLDLGVLEPRQPGSATDSGGIQLPRKEISNGTPSLLPSATSVASLLKGSGSQEQASIEVLESTEAAAKLPEVVPK